MNGFYIFVSVASLITILITFFLGRFFKNIAIVKFLPAIIFALAGIGFYIKSKFFSTGFEDLGYIVFALIAVIVFVISLITAVIMELVQRKRKRNI